MSQTQPAPSILLIEKDDVTLDIYQRELSKSFTVFAFLNPGGVLETLANRDIQAVVIEPEIASGEGWGLIDAIHNTFPDRSIPVVVCSTRDASHLSAHKNIVKYLTKPVLPNTLRKVILEVLTGWEMIKKI